MASSGGEFRGKTVEDAIAAGLAAMGLKRTQVTVEVLSSGSRGLLGFGAEDARVLITPAVAEPEPAPKPRPEPSARPRPEPVPKPKPAPAAKPKPVPVARTPVPKAAAEAAPAEDAAEPEVDDVAVEILQGMLDRMDVAATVRVVEHQGVLDTGQEPPLVLNIEGEDLGILIGRRGETLAAIQYLLRLMVNQRMRRWTNLVVDVESYKARREDTLRQLALRTAERVAKSGRAAPLEAMPARERRIVHIALRDHPDVTTQSVGEGDNRKVTVVPK